MPLQKLRLLVRGTLHTDGHKGNDSEDALGFRLYVHGILEHCQDSRTGMQTPLGLPILRFLTSSSIKGPPEQLRLVS